MASGRKKVIVRMMRRGLVAGYLPLAGIVAGDSIELLDLEGRVVPVALAAIKTICYVRDFNLDDTVNPERLTRKAFQARPRIEGLWLRIIFADGDQLEGLAPIDRSLFDGMAEDRGVYLVPPDIRSNTQRVFVPHAAIAEMQLLAVVTTPSKGKPVEGERPQRDLFGD